MNHEASASGFVAASAWQRLLATRAPGWSILVRFMVGLVVFFPEGIQKLVFPEILGAGRFANIGIPFPGAMGPLVGVVEISCGALIIFGLLTRLAAIPLIIIMIVAISRQRSRSGSAMTSGFSTRPKAPAMGSGACSMRRGRISTCFWGRSTS